MKPLREWRAERLLSADALGELAGVSNKTIVQLEHGRQTATFRTMRRICEALGIEPGDVEEFARAIAERGKDETPSSPGSRRANVLTVGQTAGRTAQA
jgi:transcriptional regulator with XRE-family HTH domain